MGEGLTCFTLLMLLLLTGGAAQAAAGTTGAIGTMLLAATDQDYQKVHFALFIQPLSVSGA